MILLNRRFVGSVADDARRASRGVLFGLFVLALMFRAAWGGYGFVRSGSADALEFPDEQQYWTIASSLHAGQGLTDELGFHAGRMPLYPALLSLFVNARHGIAWAKVIQWFIGSLAAPLTVVLGMRIFSRLVGVIAGAIVACDPYLIVTSSLLLTETLFLVALVALLSVAARWMKLGNRNAEVQTDWAKGLWIWVGLLGATCVYLKESSAGLVALVLAIAVLVPKNRRNRKGGALGAMAIIVAALSPWAIRNHHVVGKSCWLTLRGGISLYDGIRPGATGASDLGDVKQMEAVRGLSEVEWDGYFRRQSWQCIRGDPARIIRLAGVKLARTWNPYPNIVTQRWSLSGVLAGTWTIYIYALAIGGITFGGSGLSKFAKMYLLLPIVYFAAVHSLFVGSVRYRLPVVPMLAMLAAAEVAAIIRWRISIGGAAPN